jgi:hypothetical protein
VIFGAFGDEAPCLDMPGVYLRWAALSIAARLEAHPQLNAGTFDQDKRRLSQALQGLK